MTAGMDTLSKLFSSETLVKVMRFFLMNKDAVVSIEELVSHTRISKSRVKREVSLLQKIDFLKSKVILKEGSRKGVKKRTTAYCLNRDFVYNDALHSLLIESASLNNSEISSRFKKAGKVKLLVISGIFMKLPDSKVDVLVVGDNLRIRAIDDAVKNLQAEMGKEVSYAIFSTEEFKYRKDMYDKLICDVFEFPHEVIISHPSLSTEAITVR